MTTTPKISDKELIEKLRQILDGARNQANAWRTSSTTEEEYENYRDWCFGQVWDLFWETANQIEVDVDYYYSDTTYEADMQARLNSYSKIEWLIDLKENL